MSYFSGDVAVLEWELRCLLEEVAVVVVAAGLVLVIPGKGFRDIFEGAMHFTAKTSVRAVTRLSVPRQRRYLWCRRVSLLPLERECALISETNNARIFFSPQWIHFRAYHHREIRYYPFLMSLSRNIDICIHLICTFIYILYIVVFFFFLSLLSCVWLILLLVHDREFAVWDCRLFEFKLGCTMPLVEITPL